MCTGNICRSPTAERLARKYISHHPSKDITFTSAGTRALVGHPIHGDAARVLEAFGADCNGFVARRLTRRILQCADLVLTMEKKHRESVLELAPQQLHRTFTLTEAFRLATEFGADTIGDLGALRSQLTAHEVVDIADPIGQTAAVFANVGSQIANLLPEIVELCQRSNA